MPRVEQASAMAHASERHIYWARKRPRSDEPGAPGLPPASTTCLQPALGGRRAGGEGAGPSAAASPWQPALTGGRGRVRAEGGGRKPVRPPSAPKGL